MVVFVVTTEHSLHAAQYERPTENPLMSFDTDHVPGHGYNVEKGLVFLLGLCETYRESAWRHNHKKELKRNNLRFAVPEIIKEKFELPDEIEGIPVLVNKAISVITSTTFFTNNRWGDFSGSDVVEDWRPETKTSIYLFDCDNHDVYEIRDITV